MRPIKCEILGREHTVFFEEEKLEKACEDHNYDPEDTTGLYVADFREIYVSPAQDPLDVVQTFFHECCHAIGHITGHVILQHSTRRNEAFVNAVANGFVDVLRNREIYFLIGKLLGHVNEAA
ncbi:MAG: hypothetical protein QXR93_06030 [Archaeoglobaceae archaeon]